MNTMPPQSLDSLLAQERWARRLARALVQDADRAEDLLQDAYVAALNRPPASGVPPKLWLAAVMRNLARRQWRSGDARVQRETSSARLEGEQPAAEHALQILETRDLLQRAVADLPEPYRSSITARYLEELPPREIAARAGVSVGTVKSRLERGLEHLREQLDRDHGGDRRAWSLALAPLLADPPRALVLPSVRLIAAIVIVASTAATVFALRSHEWKSQEVAALELRHDAVTPSAGRKDLAPAGAAGERTAVPDTREVRVRVVDEETGARVAGAELRWWPADQAGSLTASSSLARAAELDAEVEGAREALADADGEAVISAGSAAAFVTARAGARWGIAKLARGASGALQVRVREDGDVHVQFVDGRMQPVPDVGVALTAFGYCGPDGGGRTPFRQAKSNAEGTTTLRHVGHLVNAPDRICTAAVTLDVTSPVTVAHRDPANIERGKLPSAPVVIRLQGEYGRLVVRILDERGEVLREPVSLSGLGLDLEPLESGSYSTALAVGAAGDLSVTLDSGRLQYPAVEVTGPTFSGEVRQVTLHPHPPGTRLAEGTVTGRLVDSNGLVLRNATFSLGRHWWRWDVKSTTDSEGRFTLGPPMVSGDFVGELQVWRASELEGLASMGVLAVPVRTGVLDVGDVRLSDAPVFLRGVVVADDGQPVAGARITAFEDHDGTWYRLLDGWAHTAADGQFVMRGDVHDSSRFFLTAFREGMTIACVEAVHGEEDLRLVLSTETVVEGQILLDPSMMAAPLYVELSVSDNPVARQVHDYLIDFSEYPVLWEEMGLELCRLDEHGKFVSRRFGEGEYTLKLIRAPEVDGMEDPVVLHRADNLATRRAGETWVLPTIDLQSELRYVNVWVHDTGGLPVDGWVETVSFDPELDWPRNEWPNGGFGAGAEIAIGHHRVLVSPQRSTVLIRAEGYAAQLEPTHMQDVSVELAPLQPHGVAYHIAGGLPPLPAGFALSLDIEDSGFWPESVRDAHDCLDECGASFDAEGYLRCTKPPALALEPRFYLHRLGRTEWPPSQLVKQAMTVSVTPGEQPTVELPPVDSVALDTAVERQLLIEAMLPLVEKVKRGEASAEDVEALRRMRERMESLEASEED